MADNPSPLPKGKWILAALLFLFALAMNVSIYYKVIHYGP